MSRMPEKINEPLARVHLGIDVGKTRLDIFVHPVGVKLCVSNDKPGIDKIIKLCEGFDVQLVALEATNKYHQLVHRTLHEAGVGVAVVNPYRSRKFADALGQLAKTDTIDAEVLARFAALMQPQPTVPPSEHHKALRDLNVARRQITDEMSTLSRQLHTTDHPLAARQIKMRIRLCERQRQALETEIKTLIDTEDELRHRFEILTSIPGIGVVTATTLLTDLDELGRANCREIAALAGLAPMNRDSGAMRGTRVIRGGRQNLRNMLYMCAVGLSRRDGPMGGFYRRLVREGKNRKVALIAVARKLVVIANTLIAEDRHWRPSSPVSAD